VYLQLREGVDALKAREELFATLGQISLKGPTPEELEMGKSQLALERGKALERVNGLAFEVGLSYVNADDPSYLSSLYEKLSQLGSKDIQRAVDTYFKPEHATFVDLVSKAEGS
jgi:predicted Zn-dependent peptidase